MGSYAYDYLNDSLLLDSSLITRLYTGVSDADLEKELHTYREYCLKVLPETRNSIRASDTVRCMATDTMSQVSHLKQAALYLEEAVVTDPVFKLTDFRTSATEALTSFMGMASTPKIDRQRLAKAAIKLIELRPLVVGGYVKLYPVSFELERGTEIPIIYSDVGFEDALPTHILDEYKASAEVRSVKNDNGRMLVMRDLYPCRHIGIHFKGMEGGYCMGYMLNPTEIKPTEKENIYTMTQKLSSVSPEKEDFTQWVKQSVNQTARNHFIDLNKRLALSNSLECMFGTEHPFESHLLNMNVSESDIKSNTLNCTLQMDVPFLDKVSSEDLMSIRNNDGEAFHSFRAELEKGFRAARNEPDPNRVRTIIEDTQHELFEVQMRQIEPQMKHIKRVHVTDVSIAFAGLGLSMVTGGTTLFATALAMAHGYKSYNDYKSKMTANPCHFLWNVKQKAKI
ncbi:TPA: hypothetical protein KD885_003086 [Vibrio parahaemolyticus]|nr:hypothetical protein [Vibrio parahaemolyticus]EGR3459912.1 hypothetical protein [Vibrio parahaemolyticus]EIY6180703.1 hypothetical protein [Vibrio parahaemolyticus]EJC6993160.1 hypothetical protein [Vibrio parahaemolyticus]EJC7186542.1 hypothetical protein [Vibrio parahaemolyticus]